MASDDALAKPSASSRRPARRPRRPPSRAAFLSPTRFGAVAAIGELCFVYDISVPNRASRALQANFPDRNVAVGFSLRASGCDWSLGGRGRCCPANRDAVGRGAMMKLARLVLVVRCSAPVAGKHSAVHHLPHHLRASHRPVLSGGPAYSRRISPPAASAAARLLYSKLAIVCGIFGALATDLVPFHLRAAVR